MTMLILPVVITFALRGRAFIGLWVGDEYASLSGTVLRILSIAPFASLLRSSLIASPHSS